jgi:hypothetical protein
MACCLKTTTTEELNIDRRINKELRAEAREKHKVKSVRLLLLGMLLAVIIIYIYIFMRIYEISNSVITEQCCKE